MISTLGLEALSDEQVVGRCRLDEHAAFGVLFSRYERPIYNLAYRLADNREDAEDIASATRVRIFRSIRGFKHAITLRAWINKIVVNAFYDSRRTNSRRIPVISLEATGSAQDFISDGSETYTSPHESAVTNECRSILDTAIDALPHNHRQVVSLFHHEERTYVEIAEMLHVPIGTVKSRLNRARMLLRDLLAPQMSALLN